MPYEVWMRRRAHAANANAPGLALHPAATRAELLLKERARLLRDVQKKKLQLERVNQETSRAAAEAMTKMAAVVERQRRLAAELSALFAELLAPGRLAARARNRVGRLRRLPSGGRRERRRLLRRAR